MKDTIQVKRTGIVDSIIRQAFPSYTGRRVFVGEAETLNLTSGAYWDEGSRQCYCIFNLGAGKVVAHTPNFHPMFDPPPTHGEDKFALLPGIGVVTRTYFGTYQYITIYLHRDDLEKFVPPAEEAPVLSDVEKAVLASFGVKPSYAGISDYRMHWLLTDVRLNGMVCNRRFSKEDILAARESLKAKGLVNKGNALTLRGKNLRGELGL